MATVMMARSPKRCSQVYSRFSHKMSSGSGASKMSRAYRFLQAPGGRCHQQHTSFPRQHKRHGAAAPAQAPSGRRHQQHTSFPQGSTSGTGRLPLHRHRVAAVISSASCSCSSHKQQGPAAPACSHAFTVRHSAHQGVAAPAAKNCLLLCKGSGLVVQTPPDAERYCAAEHTASCWRTHMQESTQKVHGASQTQTCWHPEHT